MSEETTNRVEKFESVAETPMSVTLNGGEYHLIDKEDEKFLRDKIQEINDLMENNDGKGLSEDEKDNLYKKSQEMWFEIGGPDGRLNDVKYNLILNRAQYRLLVSLLRDKMEYDVNTLFFAIELTNFLGGTLKDSGKYESDEEYKSFEISATDMTYLYSVLSQHKCKGLSKATYTFSEIIRRIGDISKVINYFDTTIKNLSTEIQEWTACFSDNVFKEGDVPKVNGGDNEESVTGETL